MNPQDLNTINLENIFIKTNNSSKRSLKSLIKMATNKMYNKNLITEDVFLSLGGKKDTSKDEAHESISLLKNTTECLDQEIVCHKCKNGDKKALTPNTVGFSCDAYLIGSRTKYSVRTKCAVCQSEKYSYFSFSKFPEHIQDQIQKKEASERKKLRM